MRSSTMGESFSTSSASRAVALQSAPKLRIRKNKNNSEPESPGDLLRTQEFRPLTSRTCSGRTLRSPDYPVRGSTVPSALVRMSSAAERSPCVCLGRTRDTGAGIRLLLGSFAVSLVGVVSNILPDRSSVSSESSRR